MPFQPPEWVGVPPGQSAWAVEGLADAPWPIDQKGFYLIGRSSDPQHQIDIVLGDDAVSTRHAVLCHHKEHNLLYLIDLMSRTGTRLDGCKIAPNKPVKVGNGSVVEIGPYTLRCTHPGPPSASTTPESPPWTPRSVLRTCSSNTKVLETLQVGKRLVLLGAKRKRSRWSGRFEDRLSPARASHRSPRPRATVPLLNEAATSGNSGEG